MKFQGQHFLFSLSVILELIHRPGVSQIVNKFKGCCKFIKPWNETFFPHLVKNATHASCRTNVEEFMLPRGKICLEKSEPGVQKVIDCIDKGRREQCLQELRTSTVSSTTSAPNRDVLTQSRTDERHKPTEGPVPDFPDSYGTSPPVKTSHTESPEVLFNVSNEKLPTTTAANKEVSTHRRNGKSQTPSEAMEADVPTTLKSGLSITLLDSNMNGNDRLHDSGLYEGENAGKMKQMQTTIISLIVIILLIAAVGTAIWCRRRRHKCNLPFEERNVEYSFAPSEDSTV